MALSDLSLVLCGLLTWLTRGLKFWP